MDDLLKSALVGTATQPPPEDGHHPADAATAGLVAAPERGLLLRVGARAAWRMAGYVPRRDVPAVEPCPPDAVPAASPRAAALLRAVWSGDAKALLPEFLTRLASAGRRLPPELLPDALSLAAGSRELGRLIGPVLGERGRWLARFNPEWSAAAEAGESDRDALRRHWEEGTTGERVAALSRLRSFDSGEGRAWLAEAFKSEKADVRVRLLEPLSVGLSMADEPILEEALSDRSDSVRAAAAELLARLSESRLVVRMTERADSLLSAEKTGLLKRKLKVVCSPPQEVDKEWLRDGVPKDAPAGTGRGKRAAWAEAVIGCVPPGHWTERFGAAPEDLVEAVEADDFAEAVLRGWSQATMRASSIEATWPKALAEYWARRAAAAEGKKGDHRVLGEAAGFLKGLIPRLTPAEVDRLVAPLLEQSGRGDVHRVGTPVLGLLSDLPRPWSVDLSRAYVKTATSALRAKEPRGYWWASTLADAAAALSAETLGEAAAALEGLMEREEQSPFRQPVSRFVELVRLRQGFLREVS